MFVDVIDRNKCTGCMACFNICPKGAITIQEDEGFDYPVINKEQCVNCGLCRKICPVICDKQGHTIEKEVYACKNKCEETRMKSSSGGFFTLVAEQIIEEGGVVFGARFDEQWNVIHDFVEKKEELEVLRGSKYIQSKIEKSYQKAKAFLKENRKVLFVGTPCQIEGLHAYIGKEEPNLYTIDLICHGVPSRDVWHQYIKHHETINQDKLQKFDFRRKYKTGWSHYQLFFQYQNSCEWIDHETDPYIHLFLYNTDLRKSCTDCHFKKINRVSDITMGDFWGIHEVDPEFNDEKGISAILLNSEKGKQLFNCIKDKLIWKKQLLEHVKKYNPMLVQSAKKDKRREEFFQDMKEKTFEELVEKYTK